MHVNDENEARFDLALLLLREGDTNEARTTGLREMVYLFDAPLYGYAMGIVRDADLAQELVNETFLIAYRRAGSLRGRKIQQFKSWLYKILKNQAMKSFRKHSSLLPTEYADQLGLSSDIPDLHQDVEERVTRDETATEIGQAIAKLPSEMRRTFELRHFEDRKYSEIATLMGCSVGRVGMQLFYARKRLQKLLTSRGGY
jgi:RNA polymerase sigma-70 factor (ECF subfamily)